MFVCCIQSEKSAVSYEFKLSSDKMAKRLWKTAVEHHAFFRSVYTVSFRSDFSAFQFWDQPNLDILGYVEK